LGSCFAYIANQTKVWDPLPRRRFKSKPKLGARRSHFQSTGRHPPPLTLEKAGSYDVHLERKVSKVKRLLADRSQDIMFKVFRSPLTHFRHRASFSVWRATDMGPNAPVGYKMIDPETRTMVEVHELFSNSLAINRIMPSVLGPLNAASENRLGLQQYTFLSTSDGDVLVAMNYSRPIGEEWLEKVAQPLFCSTGATVVGRSKKNRVVAGRGHLVQRFEVGGCSYPQIRSDEVFVQSNVSVCQDMLSWVSEQAMFCVPQRDLLELYCGNGNFTLPLSKHFRNVLATEKSSASVSAALECATLAAVDNIRIQRLTAKETLKAVRTPSHRAGAFLQRYDFGTILVNPPRAGLDAGSRELIQDIDHCIYVSCNVHTLVRDLKKLDTHTIVAAAIFDQFPYTPHAEVGVLLKRTF